MTTPFVRLQHVAIIGAGGTGSEIAKALLRQNRTALSIIDIDHDRLTGNALDWSQATTLVGEDVSIRHGQELELMTDADIVVITAGRGRRPGESREDMLRDNANLIQTIARQVPVLAPNAFIIILTNPADLLTQLAYEASGFPAHRVMGQGGVLDSARLSFHVSQTLNISVKDVRSLVLGGHGDSMVPVLDFVTVHGMPLKSLLSEVEWQEIVRKTRYGGAEILGHFQSHGAALTPGLAVCEMIDALGRSKPRLLPVSTLAVGAYGIHDVFLGLPALVSARGIERVVEYPLSPSELAALHASADTQRRAWEKWLVMNQA